MQIRTRSGIPSACECNKYLQRRLHSKRNENIYIKSFQFNLVKLMGTVSLPQKLKIWDRAKKKMRMRPQCSAQRGAHNCILIFVPGRNAVDGASSAFVPPPPSAVPFASASPHFFIVPAFREASINGARLEPFLFVVFRCRTMRGTIRTTTLMVELWSWPHLILMLIWLFSNVKRGL